MDQRSLEEEEIDCFLKYFEASIDRYFVSMPDASHCYIGVDDNSQIYLLRESLVHKKEGVRIYLYYSRTELQDGEGQFTSYAVPESVCFDTLIEYEHARKMKMVIFTRLSYKDDKYVYNNTTGLLSLITLPNKKVKGQDEIASERLFKHMFEQFIN